MVNLQTENATLRAQLATLSRSSTPATSATVAPQPTALATEPIRRKPLPTGPPFDGDRTSLIAWKVTITHKLRVDAAFIGDETDQYHFTWAQLGPRVQKELASYYAGGANDTYSPWELINHIEFCYGDKHGRERALAALEQVRQGKNESFLDYFVRFSTLLADAGGSRWDDDQKLARLRRGLNKRVSDIALNRGVSRDNYPRAIAQYRNIAVDLEAVGAEGQPQGPAQSAARVDADGDTIMAPLQVKGKGKHPAGGVWIPQGLFDDRRAKGLCTRCGEKGHTAKGCPNAVRVNAASVTTPQVAAQSPGLGAAAKE